MSFRRGQSITDHELFELQQIADKHHVFTKKTYFTFTIFEKPFENVNSEMLQDIILNRILFSKFTVQGVGPWSSSCKSNCFDCSYGSLCQWVFYSAPLATVGYFSHSGHFMNTKIVTDTG